jgi:hypothetical protein
MLAGSRNFRLAQLRSDRYLRKAHSGGQFM